MRHKNIIRFIDYHDEPTYSDRRRWWRYRTELGDKPFEKACVKKKKKTVLVEFPRLRQKQNVTETKQLAISDCFRTENQSAPGNELKPAWSPL